MKKLLLIFIITCLPLVNADILGFETRTCADLGVSNCVEIYPGQSTTKIDYNTEYNTYFTQDLSDADWYFLLMGDISCERSCFVTRFSSGTNGQNTVTFDLNGHTVTYSGAGYEVLPNNGFEQWTNGLPDDWTIVSGTVEARDTAYWQPMSGDWVLYTDGPLTIESSYINLPVTGREYSAYITMGRSPNSDTTIEVVDQNDNIVCSYTEPATAAFWFRGKSFACEFTLQTAGLYKLRIITRDYAYIDVTNIVPANDYGFISKSSYGYSTSIANNYPNYNFQYYGNFDSGNLGSYDRDVLKITNGELIAGTTNIDSYGVSISALPTGHLSNVRIIGSGIKSVTASMGGIIENSYLEVDMPWYFSRENSVEENVVLGGGRISNSTLIGGQGVIRLGGSGTIIENNYIRNNAQATNHYSIIQSGASNPIIRGNVFDPIEGSHILTYTGSGYRIYNNTFIIRTATCNVEYINEDYSTNAIRMNDYGSGANNNNWVYDNTFYITGLNFETAYSNCLPVTTGIFYSAAGTNNKIFDNRFYLEKTFADDGEPVFAFYIGGDATNNEGNKQFYNNYIETNDKALWINTYYGYTQNTWLENNTFMRVPNNYYTPTVPDAAIRMGYYRATAYDTKFINNKFLGGFNSDSIQFSATSDQAVYDITKEWYTNIRVIDGAGSPVQGAIVTAIASGAMPETETGTTDDNGFVRLYLTEYFEQGDMRPNGPHDRTLLTPHDFRVEYDGTVEEMGTYTINQETDLTFQLSTGSSCSIEGQQRSCGSNIGSCSQGTQTCNGGIWSSCTGGTLPSQEVCDNEDNDCDGQTDEFLGQTTCGQGICTNTIDNCVNGIEQVCDPFLGAQYEDSTNLCVNGLDDNCMGDGDSVCQGEISIIESGQVTCTVTDPLGIASIYLIDSNNNVLESQQIVNEKYYFIEAEDFDFNPDHWNVCPNSKTEVIGNSCQNDVTQNGRGASGLGIIMSDDPSGGDTNLEKTIELSQGLYKVWARSYQGGSARAWQFQLDGTLQPGLFGNEGSDYQWELIGTFGLGGNHLIEIVDEVKNGYWTYPDVLIFTTDLTFDPSVNCGNDVKNFATQFPYQYGLSNCGLSNQIETAIFQTPLVEYSCEYIGSDGQSQALSSNEYEFDGNPGIGLEDLYMLALKFGMSGKGDYDNNGEINIIDILIHINNWS